MKKTRKWICFIVLLFFGLIGVVAYGLIFFSNPKPTSLEELKPIASSLKPLIVQVETYHDAHGVFPPSLRAIGLQDVLNISGSPVKIDYDPNFELNQYDAKTGGYITSTGMLLAVHLDRANVLMYKHTSLVRGWFLLTGNTITADPIDL
ncbi:MAG: hypothetical protein LV481_15535 [Methylacidiphilales bacterium]|nr:hypothetical protein [Candidatus Methylacidiphilales bacterium]